MTDETSYLMQQIHELLGEIHYNPVIPAGTKIVIKIQKTNDPREKKGLTNALNRILNPVDRDELIEEIQDIELRLFHLFDLAMLVQTLIVMGDNEDLVEWLERIKAKMKELENFQLLEAFLT